MDSVSQLLQATRARSPLVADFRLGADVSIGLPALGGLPFHYVVSGHCCLDTGGERIALQAGDFVMLARLSHYHMETGTGARRMEIMEFAERDNFSIDDFRAGRNRLLTRDFGDAPMQTRIFSAIMMSGGFAASPLTRDLPDVTLLREARSFLEPWLVAAIEFMSAEVSEPQSGLGAIAERLIEVIFLAVLRKWLLATSHECGWMRGLTDPVISRALDAIHADPGRRWTLTGLAAASGCSRSGLARHFADVTGETPFAYLTRWRMHLAASAILAGSRSVADIGASLGYSGASAFTRVFSATFGQTPAKFRRSRPT